MKKNDYEIKSDHYYCDLLIIGGSSGGTSAAITAGRLGMNTLFVMRSPRELGGLSTNSVNPDCDLPMKHIGGIAHELDLVARYTTGYNISHFYGEGYFAPLFYWYEYLRDELHRLRSVEIIANYYPVRVIKHPESKKITSVVFRSRIEEKNEFTVFPQVVIDAEVEGDTTYLSGVTTTLKREPKEKHSNPTRNEEKYAGRIFTPLVNEESLKVSGGDLLESSQQGDTAEATVGWTGELLVKENNIGNKHSDWVLSHPPEGYNPDLFAWITPDENGAYGLHRFGAVPLGNGYWRWRAEEHLSWIEGWRLPDGRHVLSSLDVKDREYIEKEHLKRTLCGLYYLQHVLKRYDVGLSDRDFYEIQSKYTLANFQTITNSGDAPLPSLIYVREGRRMINEHVYGSKLMEAPISQFRFNKTGWNSAGVFYNAMLIDIHGVHQEVQENSGPEGMQLPRYAGNEHIGMPCIPYHVLVPNKQEARRLLVAAAGAFTHVAYSAFPRMETGRIVQGQVCAIAAALCIRNNQELDDIDIEQLQLELLHTHQHSLVYFEDSIPGSRWHIIDQMLGVRGVPQQNINDHIQSENALSQCEVFSYLKALFPTDQVEQQLGSWNHQTNLVKRKDFLDAISFLSGKHSARFVLEEWIEQGWVTETSFSHFDPKATLSFSEMKQHLFNLFWGNKNPQGPYPVDLRPPLIKDTFSRINQEMTYTETKQQYTLYGDWLIKNRGLTSGNAQRGLCMIDCYDKELNIELDIYLDQTIEHTTAGIAFDVIDEGSYQLFSLKAEGPLIRAQIGEYKSGKYVQHYSEVYKTSKRGFFLNVILNQDVVTCKLDGQMVRHQVMNRSKGTSKIGLFSEGENGNFYDNLFVRQASNETIL